MVPDRYDVDFRVCVCVERIGELRGEMGMRG